MSEQTNNIKVCLFDFEPIDDFHGYAIHTFDPSSYIEGAGGIGGLKNFIPNKRTRTARYLNSAEGLDILYRSKNPDYMRLLYEFVDKFKDFDVVILANYNPIHPEILHNELPRPTKILGFIDDPFSTYKRGIPYLWAFDAAFYISPSYDERSLFSEKLEQWGCHRHMWWPLRQERQDQPIMTSSYFEDRDIDIAYIGNTYGSKINRLVKLKNHFGSRFRIHGRWPLRGYYGIARGLLGKPVLWQRVTSISNEERSDIYTRTKIGLNMHLSEIPRESGNMRMYEVPSHGAMLLCDKAGLNSHEKIFSPDKEAIFYDSIEDAIAKIEYYLNNEDERISIAHSGFERAWRDYEWESNLKRLLDWTMNVRRSSGAQLSMQGR